MKPETLHQIHALEHVFGYAPPECIEALDPATRADFEDSFINALKDSAAE